jgi:hypothetical protein
MKNLSEPVFIDSIDCGICRVQMRDGDLSFFMPLSCFPDGAREGDWFRLTLEEAPDLKDEARSDIEELLSDLTGGSSPDAPDGGCGAKPEPES